MKTITKKPNVFSAWRLGDNTEAEQQMINEGKIIVHEDRFELFSQETKGKSTGETAYAGDYFKIDSSGYPYPNGRERFERVNICVGENLYREKPATYQTWEVADGMCPEIAYLVEKGLLRIDEDNEEAYFNATLWGADLSAAKNAHIVVYSVEYREDGEVEKIDFNLVADQQFRETYDFVEE